MMDHTEFIQKLKARLGQPLPGLTAHREMVSQFREEGWEVSENSKKSGVLILLYDRADELYLVFMKRTLSGGIHSGQISFPGGRWEEYDADIHQTALREAEEELAVPRRDVQVLGQITELFIPRSNFLVYPSVGYLPFRPGFRKAEREVAEIIEVSLSSLLSDESTRTQVQTLREGQKVVVPAFFTQGHVIWGATAMILNEFLSIVAPLWADAGT